MGISVTEASAAEINHDLLCAFIEVSAVYRFCSKPNLTVLKSCMMLSRSLTMVLCFGGDLYQFIPSPKAYIKICIHIAHTASHPFSFRTGLWKMFGFQRLLQYSNLFTFSGLKWNKHFLDLVLLASRGLPLRHVFSRPVSRELCYLAERIS